MRKEVAGLLANGKQEYARIRVEGVIRENLLMQVCVILLDAFVDVGAPQNYFAAV